MKSVLNGVKGFVEANRVTLLVASLGVTFAVFFKQYGMAGMCFISVFYDIKGYLIDLNNAKIDKDLCEQVEFWMEQYEREVRKNLELKKTPICQN
jgi:hypothetical protein